MPYDDPMNPGGGDTGGGADTGTSSPTTPGQTGRDAFLAWARPVLSRVYKMYLGRDISDGEFDSYTGPNASQGTVQEAADAVMGSPESKAYQTANPGLWGREPGSGAATTTATTTGGGGGGGGGGNGGGGGGNTQLTDWTRPWGGVFTAPTLGPGVPDTPQFQFKAPTYEQALNEPGYQFAAGEGRRLMEQSAAAKGLLNTGGTLRDVNAWGTNFAATKYNDVYGRAYQKAQDEFAPQMTAYSTTAAANQRSNEWNYSNAWNKYLFDYQAFRNWQNDAFDKYFRTANA